MQKLCLPPLKGKKLPPKYPLTWSSSAPPPLRCQTTWALSYHPNSQKTEIRVFQQVKSNDFQPLRQLLLARQTVAERAERLKSKESLRNTVETVTRKPRFNLRLSWQSLPNYYKRTLTKTKPRGRQEVEHRIIFCFTFFIKTIKLRHFLIIFGITFSIFTYEVFKCRWLQTGPHIKLSLGQVTEKQMRLQFSCSLLS